MNRAFLLILIPAALVAAAYLWVIHRLGLPLDLIRLLGGVVVFFAAVGIVTVYQRRRARPRSR